MSSRSRGYTLVEVMLALLLVAIGVMAAAPMFIYAARGSSAGAGIARGGDLALARMESLREEPYVNLVDGGSLVTDVEGYHDDSDPAFDVRWRITAGADPDGAKTIEVRAVPKDGGREVDLVSLRCE